MPRGVTADGSQQHCSGLPLVIATADFRASRCRADSAAQHLAEARHTVQQLLASAGMVQSWRDAKLQMQAPTFSARASSASSTALALCMPAACSIAATSASMSVSGECCAVRAAVVVALAAPPRGFENASVGASRFAYDVMQTHMRCYSTRLLGHQMCSMMLFASCSGHVRINCSCGTRQMHRRSP